MNRFRMSCLCVMGGLLMTGAANADAWNKKTIVTISQSIEVPGAVLTPGKYVFKLVNSDSNRHIVQIMNERENHVYATNLAFAKQRMEPADKTVLTFDRDKANYLKIDDGKKPVSMAKADTAQWKLTEDRKSVV